MFKGITLSLVAVSFAGYAFGVFVVPSIPLVRPGEKILISIDGSVPLYLRCNAAGFARRMFIDMNGAPLYAELSIGRIVYGELSDSRDAIAICTG
ncbi:hypothetical protein K8R03_04200 [Candidatus Kaiserbacteria bacterium]|nr:hypothetical protein [Candidatus Kaiserbacteria bacterium]